MKKKILFLFLSVCLLTSCTTNSTTLTQNIHEKEIQITDNNTTIEESDCAIIKNGIYFSLPNNIAYMDIASREKIILCSKAECTHKDETCNSYTATMASTLFTNINKDKIFFKCKISDIEIAESLYMCDINGGNRQVIFTTKPNQIILNYFILDEENIYFAIREYGEEKDICKIVGLNYLTKKSEELYTTSGYGMLATGYDNNLIFYEVEYSFNETISSAVTSGNVKITNYNVATKDVKDICTFELLPFNQEEAYIVKQNILLYFKRNNDGRDYATVEKIDLRTNESEILTTEFPFYGTFFQENLKIYIDDEAYIYQIQPYTNDTAYKYGYYKLNIITGEHNEVPLKYRNVLIEDESSISEYDLSEYNEYFESRKKFIPMVIVGVLDKYYFVQTAATNYITVDTETLGTNAPYGYPTIELITKEDFYNFNENYFRVR